NLSASLRNQALVGALRPVDGLCDVELLTPTSCRSSHPLSAGRVGDEIEDRIRKRNGVRRPNEQCTGSLAAHRLSDATYVRGDDRHTEGERLEKCHRQAFVA